MLDWVIPILSIITGTAIAVWLFYGLATKKTDKPKKSGPVCPGCGVSSCTATGNGDDVDTEAIRRKLAERAEELTGRAGNK